MRLHAFATAVLTAAAVLSVASPVCRAATYPAATGYVSDFAGILPDADRQALESRLRAYERSTTNEVAVAIVPSLQGQSVNEYAGGLFQAWGIGKKRLNNGVLFLWAPTERKVRIEVGYGLTSLLITDDVTGILRKVTPFLSQGENTQGVNTAVDGIIQRLGNSPPQQSTESEAQQPDTRQPDTQPSPQPAPDSPSSRGGWLIFGAILLGAFGLAMALRHARDLQLARETPAALESARRTMEQAQADRAQAETDLSALRRDAPPEVWHVFEEPLAAVPAALARFSEVLRRIEAQPRAGYRELGEVSRSLKRWRLEMADVIAVFANIRATRQSFEDAKSQSANLLAALPAQLATFADRVRASDSEQAAKLLSAADETYTKAADASALRPANWLVIHDLLMDVQVCLSRLKSLLSGSRWSPGPAYARRWPGSEQDSMAALLLIQAAGANSWAGSDAVGMSDSGGSSGGGDFGGFGGGDSGGGGASSGY